MTDRKYDLEALLSKIEWEGGIFEALEYGITAEDIHNPDMRGLWATLEEGYNNLRPLLSQINKLLNNR